jgi:uncharacterized membrane protein
MKGYAKGIFWTQNHFKGTVATQTAGITFSYGFFLVQLLAAPTLFTLHSLRGPSLHSPLVLLLSPTLP